MEDRASPIEVACLRKFAFASYGAALRVAKRHKVRSRHRGFRRVALQVYRCDYQVLGSSDENRRHPHFHVGGYHAEFYDSAF
jgi:hypothetical protein